MTEAIPGLDDGPEFDPRGDYDWEHHYQYEDNLLRQELSRRLDLIRRVESDPRLKAIALEIASRSLIDWCNDWVWTYDPRNLGKNLPTDVPFSLRPKQVELVEWLDSRLDRRENGLVEKSRDEGLTWLISAYFVHKWLFLPGFKAGIGSRKLELVDNKDNMDAIFPKIRFIIARLPDWMKPDGFKTRQHDKWCRLINPVTGASITGEGGENIGRGGRNTMYFVDEHSKLPNAEMVDHSLSQNTECVIYGGTPYGVGNLFYQKRHDGRTPVFTMHWMENPAKNFSVDWEGSTKFPWYELQKSKYDSVTIAQEVDIDYQASVSGILIPAKYIAAATKIILEESGRRTAGVDASDSLSGEGDSTVWGYRVGGNLMDLQTVDASNIGKKAAIIKEHSRRVGVRHLNYDRVGVGAGLRSAFENDDDLGFVAVGVIANNSPSGRIYDDDPRYRAKYRFRNLGSELWWSLMLRFKRTYERLHEGANHPDDECISLRPLRGHPRYRELINQLSQPTSETDGNDKIKVDKKGEGSKSPDLAETTMLAFATTDDVGMVVIDKPEWM